MWVCVVIVCPELSDPESGSVDMGGNTPGSVAVYECEEQFALVGDQTRECQDTGEWSGDEPQCICKEFAYAILLPLHLLQH